MKLCREQNPEYIAAAFDLPAPTFRHKMFPEYKANRPKMPEDLQKQIPVIKEIVSALRIKMFESAGYEADDILGTVAKQAGKTGLSVYILTRDKDCLQLIDSNIRVLREEDSSVYDAEKIKSRFGVESTQLIDVMALSGDTSDNIPGVFGIGQKTAIKLIQEFGSLENTLANLEKIENIRIREKLKNFSDTAILSKELVTINCSVPVSIDIESLKVKEPDSEKLKEIFTKLEFKNLL